VVVGRSGSRSGRRCSVEVVLDRRREPEVHDVDAVEPRVVRRRVLLEVLRRRGWGRCRAGRAWRSAPGSGRTSPAARVAAGEALHRAARARRGRRAAVHQHAVAERVATAPTGARAPRCSPNFSKLPKKNIRLRRIGPPTAPPKMSLSSFGASLGSPCPSCDSFRKYSLLDVAVRAEPVGRSR
jgi:hypothetical protein